MTNSRRIDQNDAPSRCRRRGTGLSVLTLCLVGLAGTAFPDTTRAPGNPIGPGTLPPSSYEKSSPAWNRTSGGDGSPMNLPGPLDTSGNLIITGNAGGGKYFHGYVPYRATTSLGAPPGSTQMDPFLRYTSVPPALSGYAGGYRPFYSPTGTTATTLPGYGGAVLVPSSPRVISDPPADRPADVLTLSEISPHQAGVGPADAALYGSYDGSTDAVPGRTPAEDLGWRIPDRGLDPGHESALSALTPPAVATSTPPATLPNARLLTPDDYRLQLEQLQQDIERVKANALALEQSLKANGASSARAPELLPGAVVESSAAVTPSGAVMLPQEQPSLPAGRIRPDEGLLLQPRVPDQAPVPSALQGVSGPRITDVRWLPPKGQTDGVTQAGADASRTSLSAAPACPPPSLPASTAPTGRIDTVFAPQGRPSAATGNLGTELPALQVQPTGRSLMQERFDRCLETAESYLRQGRFYRAAELFTLATTYQPNDGRPLLGKSYALFGAGEYLSSALYLARALELDPRAVLGRSDLVHAIGGPTVFAARITDLEQCAKTGDAPQLQFLLAYVYGQMNRPVEAKAALAAAEKQLSPSPALNLLKAVVGRQ